MTAQRVVCVAKPDTTHVIGDDICGFVRDGTVGMYCLT